MVASSVFSTELYKRVVIGTAFTMPHSRPSLNGRRLSMMLNTERGGVIHVDGDRNVFPAMQFNSAMACFGRIEYDQIYGTPTLWADSVEVLRY